jgi:hypothetical protein
MSNPEDAQSDPHADAMLAKLWAQDEAPDYDPAFSLAISNRIGRRQILKEVGEVALWAAPGAAVTWAVWPTLSQAVSPILQGAGQWAPVLVVAGATVFALWSGARLLGLPGLDAGMLDDFLPRSRFSGPHNRFR